MILSIIIPVYNTQNYIKECLLSVIYQSNPDTEIIVVNDGSTDESISICNTVLKEYKNASFKIINKDNGGLSSARNAGIKAATGKYIMYLDSDDMLSKDAVDEWMHYIKENKETDMFMFDAEIMDETGGHDKEAYHRVAQKEYVVSGLEYFKECYLDKIIVSACMCLYKKEYLISNNFFFTEGMLHEDYSYSYKTVINAKKIRYIPKSLYIRRYREGSIMTGSITKKNYEGMLAACNEIIETYDKLIKNDQKYRNAIARFFTVSILSTEQICEKAEGDFIRLTDVLNGCLFRLFESEEELSFSILSAIIRIHEIIRKHNLKLDDKVEDILNDKGYVPEKAKEILRNKRIEALKIIPYKKKNNKIGIYGLGKHSEGLLYDIKKEINAEVFFIDSIKRHGDETFMGYDIYNCDELPCDTDCIFISSFIYHNEIKNKLIRMDRKIIDVYETETFPLY